MRGDLARTNLPIPDRPHAGLVTYDAKDPDTSFPPIEPLRPPAGAPNVLIVLIDDTGFGSSSAFGGPCRTPAAERLAGNGLRYNRFHTAASLAEMLKLNGYSTAQFGKCHEFPVWQTSPMGPFDSWPTGSGFEYFYGFIGGETNQYAPAIYNGTVPVEPDRTPEEGYHFTEDMTDRAIDWMRQQKALMA